MKAQYFGDENDYRKYALLRLLATLGRFKIGVCWMLTPADERPDGGKRSYIQHPAKWRALDPELFDLMASVKTQPDLTDLLRIERESLIPGAMFVNETVPDSRSGRIAFHHACLSALSGRDIAFFDPDNGLEVQSRPKGRKDSSKFVYRDEVFEHYAAGRSIVIYQHFAREHRPTFLARIACDLSEALPATTIWSFPTAHAAFVLAARPEHVQQAEAVVNAVLEKWPAWFMKPQAHVPPKAADE
jgi:hypothetical protein